MKKLSRNRILAVLLMSFLLFSNYGVMGFADPGTPDIPATEGTAEIPAVAPTAEIPAVAPTDFVPAVPGTPLIPAVPATPAKIVTEYEENNIGGEKPNNLVEPLATGTPKVGDTISTNGSGVDGNSISGIGPRLFDLKETSEKAYCNDIDTTINSNIKYEVKELTVSTPGDENNLRGIVLNGYDPAKDFDAYKTELAKHIEGHDIGNLTTKEAIAATQLAIWKLNNKNNKPVIPNEDSNKRVTALAEYLSTKTVLAPTHNLEIIATPNGESVDNGITLNDKIVEIKYNYSLSPSANEKLITTKFDVYVTEGDVEKLLGVEGYTLSELKNGSQNLTLTNFIKDIKVASTFKARIEVSGTYEVEEVYDLVPVKGTAEVPLTQRLVSTPVLKSYNLPTLRQLFNIDYVPATEGTPEIPATKGTPEIPATNGSPMIPATPGKPAVPAVPGTPFIPGRPATPDPQPEPQPQPGQQVTNNRDRDRNNTEDIVDEGTPLAAPPVTQLAVVTPVEPTVEVIEEELPLAVPVIETAVVVEQPVIDVAEESVPKGAPELPKTGGFAPELLYAVSLSLIGLGYKLKK